jgi:hypothetical protein
MAFLRIYQNGIYIVPPLATSSLCHKGENTPQGHGIPPCIYQDMGSRCDYTSSLCHKEKYTQGHGIPPCISEWDLHGAASYYQQLVPQGRNIHPGTWHSSMYISEWDLHVLPLATTSLCHKEKYTPRTWHSLHVYIRIYTVQLLLPAAPQENIHPGTWFLHVYQNGICQCGYYQR